MNITRREMAKLLRKIYLIIWMHAVVRRRNILMTLFDVTAPVLLILFFAYSLPESYPKLGEIKYKSETPDDVLHSSLSHYESHIYFAPSTNFTDHLMKHVDVALHSEKRFIRGMKNEDDIITAYNTFEDRDMTIFLGIIFDDIEGSKLPKTLRYRLRTGRNLNLQETFPLDDEEGPREESGQYTQAGIAALQLYIDSFFIDMVRNETGVANKDVTVTRLVQKFPYPSTTTLSPYALGVTLSLAIIIGFSLTCAIILKHIVSEKETGVKELMKLMGLEKWMLWTGWLLDALFVNMISVTLTVLMLKHGTRILSATENAPPLLGKTDATVLWVFLITFCVTLIFCMFAISSFFEKSTLALSVGLLLWYIFYFCVPFHLIRSDTLRKLSCLFPQGGLFHGLIIISQHELRDKGLQWNNVVSGPVENSYGLTVADVFLMNLLSIALCISITYYMDAIKPGKFGIAKPWHYLCTEFFQSKNRIENMETQEDVQRNFEPPPDNLLAGIKIKNLFKLFSSVRKSESQVAVNGVTFDIYSGEITALLGHNGAGKTTIMSILVGMFSATSGSVVIGDYDIKYNLEKIRENLGLCPQQNMLFSDLTIEEHLIFFGMLKGLSKRAARSHSKDILDKLNLGEKKNCLPAELSGGMKRKLSLGIALIGDAKILILDEPTSGMDVEVRRQVWNLLLSMRVQKTILLSTHYMEEADVLGDRVAIMDHGKIKCYGTPLYLKKLYGTGYNLSIIKLDGCNESAVLKTITSNIPEATVKNLNGSILSFALPLDKTSKFPNLFDALEKNKNSLRINGIGISLTTLEEVFLNVGKESEAEASEYGSTKSETIDESQRPVDATDALTRSRVRGLKLILRQFLALLSNKILFTYRRWFTHLMKVLIAIACICSTTVQSLQFLGTDKEISGHVFSLNDYGRTEVFLHPGTCQKDLIHSYKKEIELTESALNILSSSTSIIEALLRQGVSNIVKFKEKIIVAGEFNCEENKVQANALYSNVAFHGFPISVNIMSNAILKFYNNDFSILFSYHPFKSKVPQQTMPLETMSWLWMALLPFGVLFVVSNFVTHPLLERVSKAKQLKFMAGVNPITYWLSSFLWDFLYYLAVIVMLVICVVVCDYRGFFTQLDVLGVLFTVLLLYGLAAIPFTYICSYLQDTVPSAFNLLILLNVLIGLIGNLILYILATYPDLKFKTDILDTVLHIIPYFTLVSTVRKYATITGMKINCIVARQPDCEEGLSYFEPKLPSLLNIIQDIQFFGIDCLVYFLILLLIEYGLMKKMYAMIESWIFRKSISRVPSDDDVKEEEVRVKKQLQGHSPKDVLLAYELVKKFKNFPAVKGISFGVQEGECFGLLGTNGAGKTSSFQMLTGDILPTSGEASIFEYKLRKSKQKYLSHIGYCPQFDALEEHLTGYEMISMYAKLRGVPDTLISSQINSWIYLLGLGEYSKKICGNYSGGNKRKLSAAIALVGNPPVVFLDEPTTGVDPLSRRKLWDVLGKIHKTGQAVVLTTHSMEECDALCTRLAIMVAGQFMCLGNTQYLKQKFGQGFTVMIKLNPSEENVLEVDKLKAWFQETFKDSCILKDEHVGQLHYHITNTEITWKQAFTALEQMNKTFKVIEDYTVSETTLEQIFLFFARSQETDRIAAV